MYYYDSTGMRSTCADNEPENLCRSKVTIIPSHSEATFVQVFDRAKDGMRTQHYKECTTLLPWIMCV